MIYKALALFSSSADSGENNSVQYNADAARTDIAETGESGEAFAESTPDTGETTTPDAAESQATTKTRREIYDEFIRAHKDLYAEDTQKIINRRFKEAKETEEALKAANTEILTLRDRLTEITPCQPDSDFLAAHPGFSLEKELENEAFSHLYKRGVSVDIAYSAAHIDELISEAVSAAIAATVENIRARGARVNEGAALPSFGTGLRRDVSRLTRSERADIARRAMAGEEIKLT